MHAEKCQHHRRAQSYINWHQRNQLVANTNVVFDNINKNDIFKCRRRRRRLCGARAGSRGRRGMGEQAWRNDNRRRP